MKVSPRCHHSANCVPLVCKAEWFCAVRPLNAWQAAVATKGLLLLLLCLMQVGLRGYNATRQLLLAGLDAVNVSGGYRSAVQCRM